MYLVNEDEFKQLKRRKPSKHPQDVQLITDSLKAVTEKRKKEGISRALPKIHLRKYTVEGGVTSMTDRDVVKPLQPHVGAARVRAATAARQRRAHRPIYTPRAIQHSTPSRIRENTALHSLLFGTPAANVSMLQNYEV